MTAVADPRPPAAAAPTRAPALRPGEWAVVAYAGALLVVGLPFVSGYYWTPKVAVLLVALVPGLVALLRLTVARDRAAMAGTAFVVVAGLATLLSPSPRLAVVGLYIQGTGLLFVVALVGAWALGRGLSKSAAEVLGTVIIGAAVANAVMVWAQMSSAFANGMFDRIDGRAPGLLGNPVHATAFFVGAFALAVERVRAPAGATRAYRVGYLAAALLFASGVQLSGGRTGLVLLGIVGLRALVHVGWRTTAVVVVLALVGVVVASAAFPSDSGAAARLAGSGGTSLDGRVDRWRNALPAIADRPVLGIGPGLYRRATSPHATFAAARAFGADTLYEDAHNLLVQYAVTTGILGLATLLLWLVLASVGARGELVWFTLLAGLSLLVQPEFVGLTPVLALTLGAAAPRPRPRAPDGPGVRVLIGVGLVVGVVAAALLLRGDVQFDRAARERTREAAARAQDELPMWPEPSLFASRLEKSLALATSGRPARIARDRAVDDARAATRRDPSAPSSWIALGALERDRGHLVAAAHAYRVALRWNPQSTIALGESSTIAARRGDTAAVARLCARYRAVLGRARCPSAP